MLRDTSINAYLAVFFILVIFGFMFHQDRTFAGSFPGHSLGIIGSIFILMTLIYPFRKRVLKKKGRQNPLNTHVAYGLIGGSLVVLHSAHRIASIIGILLFLSLLLVVLSGIAGRYLYSMVNRSLREQKRSRELLRARIESWKKEMAAASAADASEGAGGGPSAGSDPDEWLFRPELLEEGGLLFDEAQALVEIEYAVQFFEPLKKLFTRWTQIHYTISFSLFALMIVHVMTMLYYGVRWMT